MSVLSRLSLSFYWCHFLDTSWYLKFSDLKLLCRSFSPLRSAPLPVSKLGPHMSGDLINTWTDAAGPSPNHVRGVGVAIPGYGWTFLSWTTWMEFMSSPIWDQDKDSYMEVHTNKMAMLEELGFLAALCMLNEHACNKTLQVFNGLFTDNSGTVFAFAKGYSRKYRLLNTVIAAIKIVSQSLGIHVVVTDINRPSKCLQHHQQRWCKILWNGVKLLL